MCRTPEEQKRSKENDDYDNHNDYRHDSDDFKQVEFSHLARIQHPFRHP